MEKLINILKEEVNNILGTSDEDLEDECETTTSLTIMRLYSRTMYKVLGEFEGRGHFWVETEGQIIDLSVEQFGYTFEYPISAERKYKYKIFEKILVNSSIYEESKHLAAISVFEI